MSKWEKVRLGDVCQITMGQSPDSKSYNLNGDGLPFYQGNADFGEVYPKVRYFCNKPIKIAEKDDILISVRAPIGSVNIAIERCCIGRGLAALRTQKLILDTKYLFYVLKLKNNELSLKGTGSTFKAINKQILSNLIIPLPPLEIQKKIANTLDTVAELLALQKQQLHELNKLIESIYYEMFGDPVLNEKKWTIKVLDDLCNKITDGTHHSPENLKEGKYKYITAKNINKDGFDFSELTYVSEEVHKQIYSRCNPEYGDILYIKDGVTTGIAQINTLTEEFSMLSSVALLKHNREIINCYFLRDTLNNNNMYTCIRKNMGGAAITRLTLNKIKQIKIPVPPIELQNQYADIVSKIDVQKTQVRKAIEETQTLFDSFMSRYFND